MNNWIPVIVILAVLAGGGYYAYRKIKRKVEDVSQALFGTDSLVEGWNKQADELAATPKSVSGMTRIFEPQIQRDFPDFNLVQFKNKAENMLVSALQAIDSGNDSLIRDASEELKAQVENRIEMNRSEGIREVYEKIRIHRTEISNYEKKQGKCIITFQSAVEHLHYKKKDGTVVSGDENRLEQTKYNVEVMYIQDEKMAKIDNAVGTTCPHCGAPVTNLGAMYCEYCGLAITPINRLQSRIGGYVMGIIRAIGQAIGGTLADQWLEVIEADDMSDKTVFTSGVLIRKGQNTKGTGNTVSNGSIIHVYDNQFMMLVDGGKVVDYTAEPGYYKVDNSSLPSLFNGQFGDSLKDSFNRIKYGGQTPTAQKVFFINLQEIKGIKFGTRNPINYFDNFYNAELFLRAHGTYSVKITNPLQFYAEVIPRNADRV